MTTNEREARELRIHRLSEQAKKVWPTFKSLDYDEDELGLSVDVTIGCVCGQGCPDASAYYIWHPKALDCLAWTLNGLLAAQESKQE